MNDDQMKWLLPIGCSLAIFYYTGNQSTTDSSANSISSLSEQIKALSVSTNDLKEQVRTMQSQMTMNRIDPFSGTMAASMKEMLLTKIERESASQSSMHEKISERLRDLETGMILNKQRANTREQ